MENAYLELGNTVDSKIPFRGLKKLSLPQFIQERVTPCYALVIEV